MSKLIHNGHNEHSYEHLVLYTCNYEINLKV